MKNIGKFIFIFIISACLVLLMTGPACAASTSVEISSGTVKSGSVSVITVKYKGSGLGRVNGMLRYDSGYLEYISGGSSSGNGGAVQLKEGSDNGRTVVFKLKFKGVKAGRTSLKIDTSETYDLDEQDMGTPSAEKTVEITGAAASESSKSDVGKNDTEQKKDTEGQASAGDAAVKQTSDDGSLHDILIVFGSIAAAAVLLMIIIAAGMSAKKRKRR